MSVRNSQRNSKPSKNTVDVRSKKEVNDLKNIIETGPITIVLVYADWCGHCTRFKENVWNTLSKKKHSANLASIHHDQLENTILKDAKIKGYPSILVVGQDGKPAVFKGPEGSSEETNAMPNPDLKTLEKIADADAKTILKEEDVVSVGTDAPGTEVPRDTTASIMQPPDVREDFIGEKRVQEGRHQQDGGSLLKFLRGAGTTTATATATAKTLRKTRSKRRKLHTRRKSMRG